MKVGDQVTFTVMKKKGSGFNMTSKEGKIELYGRRLMDQSGKMKSSRLEMETFSTSSWITWLKSPEESCFG